MKIVDRVLDSLGLFEEEELEELEGTHSEKEEQRPSRKIVREESQTLEPVRLVSSQRSRRIREKNSKVPESAAMDQSAEIKPQRSSAPRMLVAAPKTFESAQEIADYMREGKAVLMNFEGTDYEIARRIVDFVSGIAYALEGNIKKVGQGVFLCAPHEVEISYDVRSDFKGTDVSDWDDQDFEQYFKR